MCVLGCNLDILKLLKNKTSHNNEINILQLWVGQSFIQGQKVIIKVLYRVCFQ